MKRSSAASLGLLLAIGCGEEAPVDDYQCTRDPALLEAKLPCATTADCPCGARCAFGVCTSDCLSDEACGENSTCSLFGECIGTSAVGLRPLPVSTDDNYLELRPRTLTFGAEDEIRGLTIRLGRRAVRTEVRVSANTPTHRVSCQRGEDFKSSCVLTLDGDQPWRRIEVRRVADSDDVAVSGRFIRVASAFRTQSVAVEDEETSSPEPLVVPGSYSGVAQLDGFSSSETGDERFDLPLRIPVTVHVGEAQGTRYPLSVEDPLALLGDRPSDTEHFIFGFLETSPDGSRVGFVPDGSQDYLLLDHAAFPALRGTSLFSDLRNLVSESGRLRFSLRQTLRIGPRPSRLTWRFILDQTGPADGLQQLPAPRAEPLGRLDGLVAAPWPVEQRWHEAMGLGTTASSTVYADLQAVVCGHSGERRRFSRLLSTRIERVDTTNREFVYYDGEVACQRGDDESDLSRFDVFPLLSQTALLPEDFEASLVACQAELDGTATEAKGSCIDLERWLTATTLGLETARPGYRGAAAIESQRLAAYLVSRQLDLNGYLAQLYINQTSFRRFLEVGDPPPVGFPDMTAFAEGMMESWSPILHPRVSEGLRRLHPRVLLQPDYRLDHAREDVQTRWENADDIHATPVHVALMAELSQQAEVWRRLVNRIRSGELDAAKATTARSTLRRIARRALLLYLLAHEIAAKAEFNRPPGRAYGWEQEWEAWQRGFQRGFTDVVDGLERQVPDVEDLSLPWYRVGDQGGTGARFTAMTDFLLGNGASLGGVVGAELERADGFYQTAIRSYAAYLSQSFRLLSVRFGVDVRTDDLAIKNGTAIIEMCGYSRGQYDAKGGYNALQSEPNPNTCYFDDSPACQENTREPTVAEAGYKLCRAAYLASRVGIGEVTDLLALNQFPRDLTQTMQAGTYALTQTSSGLWELSFSSDRVSPVQLSVSDLDTFFAYVQGRGEPLSLFSDMEAECQPVYDALRTRGRPQEDCEVSASLGNPSGNSASSCQGVAAYQRQLGELDPSCFKGELGASVLAVRSAELEVREAEAEVQAIIDSFEVDMASCNIQMQSYAELSGLYDSFLGLMDTLRTVKTVLEGTIATLDATSSCLSAMQKVKQTDPKDVTGWFATVASFAFAKGICAAEYAKAAATTALAAVQQKIDVAQDRLAADLDKLAARTELATCFNSLQLHLAELEPAGFRVRNAVGRYNESITIFRDKQQQLLRLYDEGKQWEANLEKRRLMAAAQDFDFQRRFAKLEDAVGRVQDALLYAGRAAEFELQQSLVNAAEIRRTQNLLDLDTIATELRSAVIAGRVNGGAATTTRLLLSLRDELFRVPDAGSQPEGFHQLPAGEVFREVLSSPRHAVYDASGTYAGQAYRFRLSPEALSGGREAGLAELLGNRVCGERVWAVGAVVVGENAVPLEGSTVSRMFLRKRNSFYSQRCGGATSPVSGFIDPGSLIFADEGGARPSVQDRFTNALLNANVYRGDFTAGARIAIERGGQPVQTTSELAGWGLYGDYELFIPAASISQDRLRLQQVEDIFLVMDLLLVSDNL